jgi:hypothetical protein
MEAYFGGLQFCGVCGFDRHLQTDSSGWLEEQQKTPISLFGEIAGVIAILLGRGFANAQWCDTSVEMIQKHYVDHLKLMSLRPVD